MKREELLSSPQYWITEIQSQLYEEISNYLEANNLNRSDFADQLKVTKGYISQVLNGDFNHRLSKFVELSLAVGKVPMVKWEDLRTVIEEDQNKIKTFTLKMQSYRSESPLVAKFSVPTSQTGIGVITLSRQEQIQHLHGSEAV